jgi:hypothetical protein
MQGKTLWRVQLRQIRLVPAARVTQTLNPDRPNIGIRVAELPGRHDPIWPERSLKVDGDAHEANQKAEENAPQRR